MPLWMPTSKTLVPFLSPRHLRRADLPQRIDYDGETVEEEEEEEEEVEEDDDRLWPTSIYPSVSSCVNVAPGRILTG